MKPRHDGDHECHGDRQVEDVAGVHAVPGVGEPLGIGPQYLAQVIGVEVPAEIDEDEGNSVRPIAATYGSAGSLITDSPRPSVNIIPIVTTSEARTVMLSGSSTTTARMPGWSPR